MVARNARLSIALKFALRWEGGYVNDPSDSGGATNKGVTERVYHGYLEGKGLAAQDVRKMTDTQMHDIYETGYWAKAKCPVMPIDIDTVHFDTAVNMGIGRAMKFLQKSTGCTPDGGWGPNTAAAVASCDPGPTLVAYCDIREAFYHGLVRRRPKDKRFIKGWMNRLNDLRGFVGLPGFESAEGAANFGETDFIMRLHDAPYDGEDDFLKG